MVPTNGGTSAQVGPPRLPQPWVHLGPPEKKWNFFSGEGVEAERF